jgi:DNA-binding MarR family transcriptional regulator
MKLPARRFLASLEKAKQASVGQLLLKAARLFNEQAVAIVRDRSGTGVRVAHTALFPHIAWEGTRPSELAQRLGISKQAVGQLIGELEEMGVVRREPDPSDRRASLVRFTEHGQRALVHGLGVLKELEEQLRHKVGVTTMRELEAGLVALVLALEDKG